MPLQLSSAPALRLVRLLARTKAISYLQGKHIGNGPSIHKLTERHGRRPSQVIRTVNEATEGTPMYSKNVPLTGDKETSRCKRRPSVVIDVEDDASHNTTPQPRIVRRVADHVKLTLCRRAHHKS